MIISRMVKSYLILLAGLLTLAAPGMAQEIKNLIPENVVDTAYIDNQLNTWSLRPFFTFRDHSFQIRNDLTAIRYAPTNRFGAGIGVAYNPLLLDIGANFNTNRDNPTKRFDFQGDLLIKSHFVNLTIQNYKGFEVMPKSSEASTFREDIASLAVVATYIYAFNKNRISVASVLTGRHRQKKSAYTFGVGGFLLYSRMKADSSIIPEDQQAFFNDRANLIRFESFSMGLVAAFGYVIVLPSNLYTFFSLAPWVGLNYKEATTYAERQIPSD